MPLKKTKKSDNDERESIFEEFCQALTCVGVSDWYQAENWTAKTFWAVLLIFSLVITGYEIVVTIEGLIYDLPFKTTTSRSRMQGEGIPFPNVTICNYNRIKQSALNQTKIDPKALIYMFNWFHASYDLPMSLLNENQNQMFEKAWTDYVTSKGANVSIEDILKRHGHDEDMFLGVTHFRRMVKKFEQVISIYGRCWKPAISYYQQMPGSHMGVQMIIDPQFYDYLNDVSINAFLESGILVSFTYVDEFLIPRPVSVPIGTAAKIALKLTKYTQSESQLQLRKFKCTKADTQFSMISAPYTVSNCIFNCYIETLYKLCGCIFFAVTRKPYPLCNLTIMSKCKVDDIYDRYKVCMQNCDPPCEDYYMVETSTSLATYGQMSSRLSKSIAAIAEARGVQVREEQLTNMISLDIYFDVMEVNIVNTQETTPLNEFVGNLGGQLGEPIGVMTFVLQVKLEVKLSKRISQVCSIIVFSVFTGLFVGASLLTVVQCVYYFVIWMCSVKSTKMSSNMNPTLVSKRKI